MCYLFIFPKSVEKIQVSLKSDKNKVLYMKTSAHFWSRLVQFFLEWEMLQTNVVGKIRTHFMFNNFFLKSCHLWDNMEKYYRTRQATDGNMAQAHCILDTYGYKQTLRICNVHFLSTATMDARMHLLHYRPRHIACLVFNKQTPITISAIPLCSIGGEILIQRQWYEFVLRPSFYRCEIILKKYKANFAPWTK